MIKLPKSQPGFAISLPRLNAIGRQERKARRRFWTLVGLVVTLTVAFAITFVILLALLNKQGLPTMTIEDLFDIGEKSMDVAFVPGNPNQFTYVDKSVSIAAHHLLSTWKHAQCCGFCTVIYSSSAAPSIAALLFGLMAPRLQLPMALMARLFGPTTLSHRWVATLFLPPRRRACLLRCFFGRGLRLGEVVACVDFQR